MFKVTIESDDETRIVDLTAEQQKAFEYRWNMPIDNVENNIMNQVRKGTEEIIVATTDKNPEKVSDIDKITLVKDADVQSLKEREGAFRASLPE